MFLSATMWSKQKKSFNEFRKVYNVAVTHCNYALSNERFYSRTFWNFPHVILILTTKFPGTILYFTFIEFGPKTPKNYTQIQNLLLPWELISSKINLTMEMTNQIMSHWEKSHVTQKFLRPQVPSNKRFWFFVAMRNFLFLHWKSANELKWLILREARQSRIMQLLRRINQAGIRM